MMLVQHFVRTWRIETLGRLCSLAVLLVFASAIVFGHTSVFERLIYVAALVIVAGCITFGEIVVSQRLQ